MALRGSSVLAFTEHLETPEVLLISKEAWQNLGEQKQQLVWKAAARATERQRELWAQYELGLIGYVTVQAGEIDRREAREATRPMRR